jgi:hypothetical protein
VIDLFLKIAWKVEEAANFVFIQLIEQEPAIHDKHHADYAMQDNIDLTWERISRRMEESGMCVCVYIYIYVL